MKAWQTSHFQAGKSGTLSICPLTTLESTTLTFWMRPTKQRGHVSGLTGKEFLIGFYYTDNPTNMSEISDQFDWNFVNI